MDNDIICPFQPNQDFFHNIFHSMPKPVLIFDELTMAVLDANEAALDLYGYSYDEMVRLTVLDISAETEATKKSFKQIVKKEINDIPFRHHRKKDGSVFPVEIIPTFIAHGNRTILCGVIRDISQRVQMEKALRESERRYATLLSNLPGMAYRCRNDRFKTIDFISEGCHTLTGYTQQQFMGDTLLFNHIIALEDRDRVIDEINQAVKNKRSYDVIYRIVTALGEIKHVMEQGMGIYDGDGTVRYLEGFIANVTEQKKNEFMLRTENAKLKNSIQKSARFGDIIGKSHVMIEVYDTILKASMTDVNVILYGESGTGKELAARAIHDLSDRKNKPFITVNCGAIPHELIENEFFGHKKGAFTGAYDDKRGYLDCADGGTLFLDEIGEISPNMQVKLLRALDEGGFTPVGGKEVKSPDLRIISATHKDLRSLIKQGIFREDFFYRINVLSINIPPLRKRKEDIPLLAHHFIQKYSEKSPYSIPADILNAMGNYDWPGNIRELKNVIQRIVALKGDPTDHAPLSLSELFQVHPSSAVTTDNPTDRGRALNDILKDHEREHIKKVLEESRWHIGKASGRLGIHPKTLSRKMRQYSIA